MDKVNFFFSGWEPILRIFVVGTLAYIILIILLRISGKRTLAQMSGFDFVITIAIGSTFGRLITAKGVSLAESAAAFVLLIFLQYIMAYLDVKWPSFSKVLKSDPSLLFYRGKFLDGNLHQNRVTRKELLGVIRQKGIGSMEEVEAIVLEPAGKWSVIPKSSAAGEGEGSSLRNVEGVQREQEGS
ncbi:DUF421 domain-containing protein [Nafulsella turpanensis]|uniref:DUF421 domain-containing protein n=1 Tax=Nafulsella turpanensis TaxID=1265690 RepID=UPI000349F9B0|nr:YetF domain-containing protein [Nafulsella turpanensis]